MLASNALYCAFLEPIENCISESYPGSFYTLTCFKIKLFNVNLI